MSIYIRIRIGWDRHPKIARLRRRLGSEAVYSLLALWMWTGEQRPSGVLSGMEAEDIAIASMFTGSPADFVETLVALRLLDRGQDGVFSIHDWADYQPEALRRYRYEQSGGYDENGNRLFPSDWQEIKASVYKRDGRQCQYCGTSDGPFHVDHVVPRIHGGPDALNNLVVACATCNMSKGSKSVSEWMELSQ